MAEEAKGEEVPAGPEVGSMQTGDYMIHIYVMSGKNFKSEGNDTVDPLVTVETCGEKKYTQAKSEVPCGSATMSHWKEHLFFEPRNIHSSKIEMETISIKVMNKGMFRDEMIGTYEFDMTTVYFKQKHAIQHQWIALFNPESEDFSEITGNLKISIAVQGPGDEQVQLNDQVGPDSVGEVVLMPAQIKKEFKQLKIRFIQAEKLPKMDTFGTIDAYIRGKFHGKKIRTVAVTAKNDVCAIEQEFWLPIQWPLASDRLLLSLYDEDKVVDEIVGSMYFSLKKLIADGANGGKFFWHNMYGAPNGCSGQWSDLMNNQPEVGSSWKGRILMQIEAEDAKHPERKEQPLEDGIKQRAISEGFFEDHEFEVIGEIGMGISLPSNAKEYRVMIKIGDFELVTEKPKEAKHGYNRWSERFAKTIFKTTYPDVEQMEQLFVYLLDGDKKICYWKGRVSEFTDPNPKYRWLILKNDKSLGKVKEDHEAGMIQMKFSINDKAKNGPVEFKSVDAWKKPPPRRLGSKKIRCFIFQCRDIPAADSDGASDSYISVWNPEGETYRTRMIEDSLNPIYFETIEMLYDMADLETAPPIIFNVWDHDDELMDAGDDFLGRAVIYLRDAKTNLEFGDDEEQCNSVPKPDWHDIRIGFDETTPPCGQVLCSFVVARDDFDFQTPAKYLSLSDYVPTKEYDMDINVLGLRQLESFGLMPIKKPFVKFRVKSLLPPEKAQAVTNVSTDPNACGPNPNINTMLTFNVQLPIEELYCPSLACDCFDYVFMGLSQPLIGTFSIPVGALKTKAEKRRVEDLKLFDRILAFLRSQMRKSDQELAAESNISHSKSLLSEEAQKRMQTKLKNQANKLRGAAVKSKAIKALGQGGKSGGGSAPPGYDEVVSQDDRLISRDDELGREEQRLIEDETLYQDLDENDPLILQRRALTLAKAELEGHLQKRADAKAKPSPAEEALKAGLQKRLLVMQVKFKEEQKKAEKVKREIEKQEMKNSGSDQSHQNIILPKYVLNKDLNVYEEVDIPPTSLYKAVGFNDMQRVKIFMEGDDADKRSDAKRESLLAKSQIENGGEAGPAPVRSQTLANVNQKQTELDAVEEANRQTSVTNLHYRKYYQDELENDKSLFPDPDDPFIKIPIKRGQSRGLSKSWFSFIVPDKLDESGEVSNEKIVGYFKGRVKIENEEETKAFNEEKEARMTEVFDLITQIHRKMFKADLEFQSVDDIASQEKLEKFSTLLDAMNIDEPELLEFFKDASYDEVIKKQLLSKTQCKIELYVLEGFDLASRDIGSFSDPYLFIRCGNREFSERDNYQLDEANPKFYKLFEFTGEFPGAPMIEIMAFDYDDLFGDDLIGKTSIDLDDRFFNGDWQAIEEKPIEERQIYHESTSLSQGVLTCWLEIEPSNKQSKQQKVWDIAPEPVKEYQIRLSVMDTVNVPCEDFEGVSDVFIRSYVDDDDKKDTDTHFRCSNGKASFNYRILFDVKSPRENPLLLVMQAWDFDLFKSNDYLCEWTLDLDEVFKNVRLTQQQVILSKQYYNAFLKKKMPAGVSLEFRDDDSFILTTYKDGKDIKLRIDLRIVPIALVKAKPVGPGRENPNMEPYLPPPIGRIQFSLNPCKMLSQLVGPEFLAKLYGILCVCICCALCIFMLPMLLSNFSSTILMKIFGIM